ncbi:MAG TPA: hypothetical protein VJ850_00710 [Candidatus Limnocylindrales bacterium]|nr:hypothetical protein [Candidatus Limnocylindrales bacterium]
MKRLASLVIGIVLVAGACSQTPSTGQQPGGQGGGAQPTSLVGPGDIKFTVTFTFDTSDLDPDVWNRGTFTTVGSLSSDFLARVTEAPTYPGSLWQSSGDYTFSDWQCTTPDECLVPCAGSYGKPSWQDKPQVGLLKRSGSTVVVSVLLSATPKPDDDQFLQTKGCPITTGNAMDGFPRMKIFIDGLGSTSPKLAVDFFPFDQDNDPLATEAAPTGPASGGVWSLTIKPA